VVLLSSLSFLWAFRDRGRVEVRRIFEHAGHLPVLSNYIAGLGTSSSA
jgi:hypothetical protein